jgi:hypothetical protein
MLETIQKVINGEIWEELVFGPYEPEPEPIKPIVEPVAKPMKPMSDPLIREIAAFEPFKKVQLQKRTVDQRKQYAIREVERLVGTSLDRNRTIIYAEAYRMLMNGSFHQYCSKIIGEYHAGDCNLRQLLLRGALRASFSSKSALLHFAMTGKTGSGKNDLIENVAKILPVKNVVLYSSVTPQVLYYEMRVPVPGVKNGWTMNPDHFKNCIICITEIADSKAFTALKAFAELNEFSSYTHKATSGQKSMNLTVKGPRAVWVSSVLGIKDDQANRRFIHSTIDEDNRERREARVRIITDTLTSQTSLGDDPRKLICRAGFDLLFSAEPRFEAPKTDVTAVISDMNVLLDRKGYSPSQFKQLYALIECGAALRQFQRGYCRIEMQDVLEGWYLSGFECEQLCLGGQWIEPLDPMDGGC